MKDKFLHFKEMIQTRYVNKEKLNELIENFRKKSLRRCTSVARFPGVNVNV